mmetsp:Transcript_64440/g.189004  ORF Transcript_64440/g.189004 Transcript_64440/m.189004 type:complete len:206 (-) Transcript_64440:57-674(-)
MLMPQTSRRYMRNSCMPSLMRSPVCFGWLQTRRCAYSSSMWLNTIRLGPETFPVVAFAGGLRSIAKSETFSSLRSVLQSVWFLHESVGPEPPRMPPAPSKSLREIQLCGVGISMASTRSLTGMPLQSRTFLPLSTTAASSLASTPFWSNCRPSMMRASWCGSRTSLSDLRYREQAYLLPARFSQSACSSLFSSQTARLPRFSAAL